MDVSRTEFPRRCTTAAMVVMPIMPVIQEIPVMPMLSMGTEMMSRRPMLSMRGLEMESNLAAPRESQETGRNTVRDSSGSGGGGSSSGQTPGLRPGIGGLIRSLSTRGRDILERPEIWREISNAESGWFVVCRGEECEVVRVPTGEEAGGRGRRRSSEGGMRRLSAPWV